MSGKAEKHIRTLWWTNFLLLTGIEPRFVGSPPLAYTLQSLSYNSFHCHGVQKLVGRIITWGPLHFLVTGTALLLPPPAAALHLTLRLLMSYIYGAPSKARNANVVYIWIYVWQRCNSLFLFAAQCFNTESMQRGFLCHIFV